MLFGDLSSAEADALEGGGEQAFGGQIFRGEDGGLPISIDPGYLFGGNGLTSPPCARRRLIG